MKYAIFTFEGNGFPLAYNLLQEDQEVIVGQVEDVRTTLTSFEKSEKEDSFDKKQRLSLYKNIIPRISADNLVKRLKKIKKPQEYFIFCESNNLFRYAGELKNLGFHGNFPEEKDRIFEINRNQAKNFVKEHYSHLKISEKKDFRLIKDAEKFLEKTNALWVLKSQTDLIPTFVPHTNNPHVAKKQIIDTLHAFQPYFEDSGFLLEHKIPSIIEITPEKLYYDGIPLGMTILLENKFIGSGNLSFQVGCAGDIVFPADMQGKIHDIAFPPIVDRLAKEHKGLFIWDASLLIDSQTNDVYFGEFCPNRPGYNSFYTELAQLSSVSHFFECVVQKKNPFKIGTVGVSLMLFNLVRNIKTQLLLSDVSIYYPRELEKDIWPYNIYKKTPEGPRLTVGYDHHLSPVTAADTNLFRAVDKLYKNVESFEMASVYYRPKFDFLSKEYPTSLLNRLEFSAKHNFFSIPFEY